MKFTAQDERFMRRALALARRGVRKTSPNPVVGAVLVGNGRIIGEGWHKHAGGPHAEVEALRAAGKILVGAVSNRDASGFEFESHRSRIQSAPTLKSGAPGGRALPITSHQSPITTLYVTLEPCCTWGRTPPCTDAIIAAGVKRVVVAARDPNPKHNGRGLKILRRAGIRVESGLLANEATRMNEGFNKWITTGMPFVIAKAAMSLDGKIATRTGDSKWITSEAARRVAHQLRAKVDAVMVGANTVIRDNPQLTLRHGVQGRQPWRVVVDARGRSSKNSKLFTDAYRDRTIVITSNKSPAGWRRYLPVEGITVITLPWSNRGVDLRAALRALGRMNVTSVLVEGGGELLGSMFDARLVDRVALFYAPIVIGGGSAVSAVAGSGAATVKRAVKLRNCRWRRVGQHEMLLEAEVAR